MGCSHSSDIEKVHEPKKLVWNYNPVIHNFKVSCIDTGMELEEQIYNEIKTNPNLTYWEFRENYG